MCLYPETHVLSSMCLSMKSRCSLFAHHHLDCFQLIMPLKNVKNACQFYIRNGITRHIFSFIAKNIFFLESLYWALLSLMSIWISPAVQVSISWQCSVRSWLYMLFETFKLQLRKKPHHAFLFFTRIFLYWNSYQLSFM